MLFALPTKTRKRNMATPEETRDRIKEMRDRIFKDSNENNIQKNPKKKDLAEIKPKILETVEALPSDAKPLKPQEESSSEKLQQDDDRISLLSSDTQKKISEIKLIVIQKQRQLHLSLDAMLNAMFFAQNYLF